MVNIPSACSRITMQVLSDDTRERQESIHDIFFLFTLLRHQRHTLHTIAWHSCLHSKGARFIRLRDTPVSFHLPSHSDAKDLRPAVLE